MMDLEAELDRLSADLEDSLSKNESLAVKLSSQEEKTKSA